MRGRIWSIAAVPVVLVLSAALTACSGDADDNDAAAPTTTAAAGGAAALTANPWNLDGYRGADGEVPAAPGQPATLVLAADGTLSGSTGCNNVAGTYTVDGEALTSPLGPRTRRACTDPALDAQERALVPALGEVTGFAVDGTTLTLRDDSGVRFTYEAEDTSLVGAWTVTGVNNGTGGVVSSAATEALAMVFTENLVTVSGGCNTLSANVVPGDAGEVSFGPVSSTKKACEGEAAEADQWMTEALGRTRDYEVLGGTLTMRDAEGAMQVTATRG